MKAISVILLVFHFSSLASSGSYKLKLSLLSEPPKPNGEIHKCLFRFKLLDNLRLEFEPITGVDSIWVFYSKANFFLGKLLFISDFSYKKKSSFFHHSSCVFSFFSILISYSCCGRALIQLLSNEIVIFFQG